MEIIIELLQVVFVSTFSFAVYGVRTMFDRFEGVPPASGFASTESGHAGWKLSEPKS